MYGVSENQAEVLLQAVQTELHSNMAPVYIRFRELKPGAVYKDTDSGVCYAADILMEVGLPFLPKLQEYQSYQLHLTIQS